MTNNCNIPEHEQSQSDLGSATATAAQGPASPQASATKRGRVRNGVQWEDTAARLRPMLLQRLHTVEIAREFGVSVDTIGRWKNRLILETRKEAVTMQPRDFIMDSYKALQEARAESWKCFTDAKLEADKTRWMGLILRVESEIGKLGTMTGMFKEGPLKPSSYGEDTPEDKGAPALARMAEAFLSAANSFAERSNEPSDEAAAVEESYDALFADEASTEPEPEVSPPAYDQTLEFQVRSRKPPVKYGNANQPPN